MGLLNIRKKVSGASLSAQSQFLLTVFFVMTNRLNLWVALFSIMALASCKKEEESRLNPSVNPETTATDRDNEFSTTVSTSSENGMLVFNNFNDLGKFVDEVNKSSSIAGADAWESQHSVTSQRQIFNKIVEAEGQISDYQETLPAAQQSPSEIHSEIFQQYLASGLIKYVNDSDGSSYWDYALSDPSVAPAVNERGLVKVEGKIYQFGSNGLVKIIKDGDYAKVPLLVNYTQATEDNYIKVVSSAPEGGGPLCSPIDFSTLRNWKYPTNKKRVKAEIIGNSVSNFGDFSGPCAMMPYGATCNFTIRTQAQVKNFWGNWVYKSNFSPSLTISAATWSYRYTLFNNSCFGSTTTYTNVGINGQFPTPTYTGFYPATNNGTFGLNPHTSGWWLFNNGQGSKRYITCGAIDVFTYNIPVSYYIYGPSDWSLIK
jgi:hypothetical protein